jgi:uncharacterized protein YbbC (DUF1343 family)
LEPAADALARAGFTVQALFAPEHGMEGALQDQTPVGPSRHPRLGLPVHSLYGDPTRAREFARLSPSDQALEKLDALVFDLQDIGVRYYTFVWTMALAMAACARRGKPFLVLDRPNPLGGDVMEGNLPDPDFLSFVGLHPVPARHGLTAGELALWLNETSAAEPRADLTVIPMKGWRRRMWGDQTGLPWIMPSPNMPTLDTAAVYAGMCLVEGTNISEGRGTTRPFELIGAPWLDGPALAETLNDVRIPGAFFRACAFRPAFHKWSGHVCRGVQVHVTDRDRFPSFLAGLELIAAVRRLRPGKFSWASPPYEYESRKLPFDLLSGDDEIRRGLERGVSPSRLESSWREDRRRFRARTRPFHLYE